VTTVGVAVCAHHTRIDMAERLALQLRAPVVLDNGQSGIIRNHDNTLRLAAECNPTADWVIAVEDDAQPVAGFLEQAVAALAVAPTPMVSLYHGWKAKPRYDVQLLLRARDPHWVMMRGFTSAVCIAVRRDSVEALLNRAADLREMTVDQRYSEAAARLRQMWIAHAHPSLVQHADVVGVGGPAGMARRAYEVGTRDGWTGKYVRVWRGIW
jgi:hypothetical protein